MDNTQFKDVSIIVVTYNNEAHINNCLNSIYNQFQGRFSFEVVIVDNSSRDNTVKLIKNNFKDVKLIKNDDNKGYGYASNIGVKYANGKYLIIMNPDTIVEKLFIENLIYPLTKNIRIITTPKVLIYNGNLINSCGIILHFTGLGFTRGYKQEKSQFNSIETVTGIFGCCFALKKEDFNLIGQFDSNIFLYGEDTELSWRSHIKNFKIVLVPKSILKHDYTLEVPPHKIYYLEKARYLILRKYLSLIDIILLSPSLILAEILTWGYALKFGKIGIYYKLISIKDSLNLNSSKMTGNKKKLIESLDAKIPTDQLTYNKFQQYGKKLINHLFLLNWEIYKYIIKK
jgi:hypothetical protein